MLVRHARQVYVVMMLLIWIWIVCPSLKEFKKRLDFQDRSTNVFDYPSSRNFLGSPNVGGTAILQLWMCYISPSAKFANVLWCTLEKTISTAACLECWEFEQMIGAVSLMALLLMYASILATYNFIKNKPTKPKSCCSSCSYWCWIIPGFILWCTCTNQQTRPKRTNIN